MKKIILTVLILVFGFGLWWTLSPQSNHASSPLQGTELGESILKSDYEKLTKTINPKIVASTEWKDLISYQILPSKIVNKENSNIYLKMINESLPELFICLKKDYCGMTTRNDDDAYFDDQKTPSHILINRQLKVLKELLALRPELANEIDWELLIELARFDSELIQVEALDIISEHNKTASTVNELIKVSSSYQGNARAQALLKIAQSKDELTLSLVTNEIEEIFEMADANTVLSVLENLKKMSIGQSNLENVLKNLCRFKTDESQSHNWTMIKYETKSLNANLDSYCQ